ncbi:diguanylate cyclase domain-containing protein [Nitrincola sp.]|uniref:diguanylate cyclase domain-containing protein n=1 Tax=Nitrincola sp. TaxID=1926584 RepID=UPI003A8F6E87
MNVSYLAKPERILKNRRLVLLFLTLLFALFAAVFLSLWSSFKHSVEQTQQRIIFQSQLLERSVTRTLESVESAMVSLDRMFAQPTDGPASDESVEGLRRRVDEMIHFAPHIHQILVTEGTQVLVDSASRSEGREIDASRIGLDLKSSDWSRYAGLRVISTVNQRFLPLIDQHQGASSTHSVVVTGLRSGSQSTAGDFYWILVALNPEYFTDFFLTENPDNTLKQEISLLSFEGERLVSMLPSATKLPPVSEFLQSGRNQQLYPTQEALHAWSLSSRYPVIISVTQSQRDFVRNWWLNNQAMLFVLCALVILMLISMAVLIREVTRRVSIQQQMALLSKAVEQSNVAVILTDNIQRVVYVNPAVERLFGYSVSYIMGKNPRFLGSAWTDRSTMDSLRQALQEGSDWEGELINRTAKGDLIPVATRISAVLDETGSVSHFVGVMEDVTERKQHLEQLHQQNIKLSQLATVFTHAHEGIIICCPRGEILEVNDAFCVITGYDRADVLGKNPRLLHSGHHDAEFYESMWRSINIDGHWSGELWNRRKDGEVYVEHITITAVQDDSGDVLHYVSLFSDISRQKQQELRLQKLAHFDPLTGLPNRSLLHDRLQQAMHLTLRRERLIAVVFIDLDGFKRINDDFGHAAGDSLLCFLAEQMKQTLREGDTLARIGGDEFVAVLTDLADTEACEIALRRILKAAMLEHQYKTEHFHVSASMGATLYPQVETVAPEQLLHQADQIMYAAKESGKNQFQIYDSNQNTVIHKQLCLS